MSAPATLGNGQAEGLTDGCTALGAAARQRAGSGQRRGYGTTLELLQPSRWPGEGARRGGARPALSLPTCPILTVPLEAGGHGAATARSPPERAGGAGAGAVL